MTLPMRARVGGRRSRTTGRSWPDQCAPTCLPQRRLQRGVKMVTRLLREKAGAGPVQGATPFTPWAEGRGPVVRTGRASLYGSGDCTGSGFLPGSTTALSTWCPQVAEAMSPPSCPASKSLSSLPPPFCPLG